MRDVGSADISALPVASKAGEHRRKSGDQMSTNHQAQNAVRAAFRANHRIEIKKPETASVSG